MIMGEIILGNNTPGPYPCKNCPSGTITGKWEQKRFKCNRCASEFLYGESIEYEEPVISVKMEISGRLLERFERVKERSGIEASTEAVRHCITLAHRHYLEELS
jgi:hypothetical protein